MRDNFVFRSARQTSERIEYPLFTERIENKRIEKTPECMSLVIRDGKEELCGHPTGGKKLCFKHDNEAWDSYQKYKDTEKEAKKLESQGIMREDISYLNEAIRKLIVVILHREKVSKIFNGQKDKFDHKGAVKHCEESIQRIINHINTLNKPENSVSDVYDSDDSDEKSAALNAEADGKSAADKKIAALYAEAKEKAIADVTKDYDKLQTLIIKDEVIYNQNFDFAKQCLLGEVGKYLAVYYISGDVKANIVHGSSSSKDSLSTPGLIEVWLQFPIAGKDGRPGHFIVSSVLNVQPSDFKNECQEFVFGADVFDRSVIAAPQERQLNKWHDLDYRKLKNRKGLSEVDTVLNKATHTLLYLGKVSHEILENTNIIRLGISEEDAANEEGRFYTKKVYANTRSVVYDKHQEISKLFDEESLKSFGVNPEIIKEKNKLYEEDMKELYERLHKALALRPSEADDADLAYIQQMQKDLRTYGRMADGAWRTL